MRDDASDEAIRERSAAMTISEDFVDDRTTCVECGDTVSLAQTVVALDGSARRCADDDACHDRKEARSSFTPAAC